MVLCKYNEQTKQWEIIGGYSEVIASAVEKKIIDNNTQFVTPAINEHAGNADIHVTAEEKASWNGKAEFSDIPTALPADGGNADTLDGFHETSFSRNRDDISDCNNAVLPGTYNAVPETINTPYSDYWLVTVDIGASGTWIRQTATHCNTTVPTETYHRLFINDAWNSWTKINGNADIARKVETTNQKAFLWEDIEGGNLKLVSPDGNHSVEMDLYNNAGFRMYFTDNGELTFPVDYNFTTKKFNINGNAASVNGYTITAGTEDLEPGVSPLPTGTIHIVYE